MLPQHTTPYSVVGLSHVNHTCSCRNKFGCSFLKARNARCRSDRLARTAIDFHKLFFLISSERYVTRFFLFNAKKHSKVILFQLERVNTIILQNCTQFCVSFGSSFFACPTTPSTVHTYGKSGEAINAQLNQFHIPNTCFNKKIIKDKNVTINFLCNSAYW